MDFQRAGGAGRPCSLPEAEGLVQDFVAATLPQADRLRLAATCSALRSASLHWFPEVWAELARGDSAAGGSLAAWLCRYRARAHVTFRQPILPERGWKTKPAALLQLAARPAAAARIVSLGGSPGEDSSVWVVPTDRLLAFPSLEGVEGGPSFELFGPLEPLWQLTQLQRLRLRCSQLDGSWEGLARLPRLRRLELEGRLRPEPALSALPALACHLTALTLHASHNDAPAGWAALAQLTGLQSLAVINYTPDSVWSDGMAAQLPARAPTLESLVLCAGGLTQAPPQLAACSRLTRLELTGSRRVEGAFFIAGTSLSVLGALTRLQHLAVSAEAARPVPSILSELSTLTHLSLHAQVGAGFSRLQPLTLLRELSIGVRCLHRREASDLAATLAAASCVTSLGLSGSFYTWGPAWRAARQMTQLRALALDDCDAGPLPAGISRLAVLTRLSLGRSSSEPQQEAIVVDSLEHLRPLAGTLAHLSLAGWQLTAIPLALAALTALSRLDLSGSDICAGWEELRALPRLARFVPPPRPHSYSLNPLTVMFASLAYMKAYEYATPFLLSAGMPSWSIHALLYGLFLVVLVWYVRHELESILAISSDL